MTASLICNRINRKVCIPQVNFCSESAETFFGTTEELAREVL
jgi:hypothetical protein